METKDITDISKITDLQLSNALFALQNMYNSSQPVSGDVDEALLHNLQKEKTKRTSIGRYNARLEQLMNVPQNPENRGTLLEWRKQ